MKNKINNIMIILILITLVITGCSAKQEATPNLNIEENKLNVDIENEAIEDEGIEYGVTEDGIEYKVTEDGVEYEATENEKTEDDSFYYYDCPSTECDAFIKKGFYFCPMCLDYFVSKTGDYVYKNSNDSDEWESQKFWDTQIESFLSFCEVDLSNVEEVKQFLYDNGDNGHGEYKGELREALLNDMALRADF